MAAHDYRVRTLWRVHATIHECADVLHDPAELPRWWPAAFLDARVISLGKQHQHGLVATMHTKGWLPYTLRFEFTVAESSYPASFVLAVDGDFVGRCDCRAEADGPLVRLEFDWQVRVNKPVVKYLSPILKGGFIANHKWVMARGLESLRIELARRRAIRTGGAAPDAAPPAATFPYSPRSRAAALWVRRLKGAATASMPARWP